MSSRRPLLIAFLVAVAGLLAGLLTRLGPEKKAPVPVPKATANAVPVVAAPQPTASPQRTVIRTETYFEPLDESQITGKQAAAAASRYRKAARFPRTSRPLDDGLDPIATSRAPKVDFEGDDQHREPRLLAYPSITSFESPSEVVIYAEVVELRMAEDFGDDGKRGRDRLKQFRTGARSIRGVIQTVDGVLVTPLEFRDDGTKGDAQAGDNFFTATYTPDPDRPNDFRGEYRVVAQAETLEGDEVMATSSFVYSLQIAHLTGRYRDAIVNGNLQIEAEVEVDEAGRVRLEGTLVTTVDAKMLGFAFNDVDLAAGTVWIPLTFYGLIFHDMKAAGPYSLFSTALSTLGGATVQESDVVPNAHTTKAYAVTDFSSAPFNDPEYAQKADYYDGIARAKGGK